MTAPVSRRRLSPSKLVLFSLGAGVVVLVVAIPLIFLVARWSPIAGLVVALLAVIVMIAAIGAVSRKMVADAERDIITSPTDRNIDGHLP